MAYGFYRGASKLPEIDQGAKICKLIKEVYFADQEWSKCCYDVAEKFTQIKSICKDKAAALAITVLDLLLNFDQDDLKDHFDAPQNGCKPNTDC